MAAASQTTQVLPVGETIHCTNERCFEMCPRTLAGCCSFLPKVSSQKYFERALSGTASQNVNDADDARVTTLHVLFIRRRYL